MDVHSSSEGADSIMNLDLSDEQEEIRATARKFLDATVPLTKVRELWETSQGFDRAWWLRAAELGWCTFFAPPDLGGGGISGMPVCDAVIIAEEIGRSVGPGPFQPINACVAAISGGSDELRQESLPSLLSGSSIAAWAFAESGDQWESGDFMTTILPDDGAFVITGEKRYVEAIDVADIVVVTGRTTSGLTQVVVPVEAPGVNVLPGRSIDMTRRFGTVTFDAVRVPNEHLIGAPGGAGVAVQRQLHLLTALHCAEIVGAAGEVFETTVQYSKDRHAFGRPIGSFQALKHRFADMLQRLEFSRATTDAFSHAIDNHEDQPELDRHALVAKCYVADACLDIVDDCVQISGGIGVTWEHDIHMFSRRVAVDRALYGSPELLKESLADLLGVA